MGIFLLYFIKKENIMEILKVILSLIGISTATIYIFAKITAGIFTTKIKAKKIAFVAGSICLIDIISYVSTFGGNPMLIIAMVCWIPTIAILASEIREGK
jgi:hypothetical protein